MLEKIRLAAAALALSATVAGAALAAPLTPADTARIDASVRDWLKRTGAPSASIAVVRDGKVAYARAYGLARTAPATPATPASRYAIASVSKEFTAVAILILQAQGKLSLDDKVSRFLPDLASADRVTLRQLLSHTAGYRDFWPQDFVPPEMTRPVTVQALLDEWAKKPLDFEPGADWQYSNTGYAVAGAIVEKASGQPLLAFLQAHVFQPLHMEGVIDHDALPERPSDALPYTRYGLGPVRPAAKEGRGWLFAAGELAMTPTELAKWDISLMDRSLLTPASYEAMLTPVKLTSGRDTHYGLGLDIEDDHGRLRIGHGGEASGMVTDNRMWPAQRTAVVVTTNSDAASAESLNARVAAVAVAPTAAEARARRVFDDLRQGRIERDLFTANGNSYLTAQALADHKAGLGRLGPAWLFQLASESQRGGMTTRVWTITTSTRTLRAVERGFDNGKLEQFLILDVVN